MHMYPHSLTEDKCLSLRLFKPLKQHSASILKRLKTAFQKNPRSQRHRSLTWETPLDHCCTSVPFRVSAFLINIQCWKQLKSSPRTLCSLFCRPWAYFLFPLRFYSPSGQVVSLFLSREAIN